MAILMYNHEIEPIALLLTWLKELHVAIAKLTEQPFISNIAQTKHGNLCAAFLEQHRLDFDIVIFGNSSKVVDKPSLLEDI